MDIQREEILRVFDGDTGMPRGTFEPYLYGTRKVLIKIMPEAPVSRSIEPVTQEELGRLASLAIFPAGTDIESLGKVIRSGRDGAAKHFVLYALGEEGNDEDTPAQSPT